MSESYDVLPTRPPEPIARHAQGEPSAPSRATRQVLQASTGARLCVLVGLLVLVCSGYLLTSPLARPAKDGSLTDCGSAISPPSAQFVRGVCVDTTRQRQLQAEFLAGAGLLVAVGGFFVFGSARREDLAQTQG